MSDTGSTLPYYRRAPNEARRAAVWYALSIPGLMALTALGILYATISHYVVVATAVPLLAIVGYFIHRAATIAVEADKTGIVVNNPYRTYRLRWEEIETVRASSTPALLAGSLPVVLIRTSTGVSVEARAVPREPRQLEEVVRELLALAPAHMATRSGAER